MEKFSVKFIKIGYFDYLKKLNDEDYPALLIVHSLSCLDCYRLYEEMVSGYYNKQVTVYSLEETYDGAFLKKYSIVKLPLFLKVNQEGNIVDRKDASKFTLNDFCTFANIVQVKEDDK